MKDSKRAPDNMSDANKSDKLRNENRPLVLFSEFAQGFEGETAGGFQCSDDHSRGLKKLKS